jgi:hypothetical protein
LPDVVEPAEGPWPVGRVLIERVDRRVGRLSWQLHRCRIGGFEDLAKLLIGDPLRAQDGDAAYTVQGFVLGEAVPDASPG